MVAGLLATVLAAAPFLVRACDRYAPAARVAEARGRIAFILTAARSYADEHESDNDPATADWPAACGVEFLADDCAGTPRFTYEIRGERNADLVITARGRPGTAMTGVEVRLTVRDPRAAGELLITGL